MLRLSGELDRPVVDDLREQLEGHVHNGQLAVDMAGVTFMDSSVLNLLLRFATTHDFTIHNPSRIVRRVLQVADVPAVLVPTDAPEEPAVATTEA